MKVTIRPVESGKMTIQIEGRIVGLQVAELDRAFQEAEHALGETKLLLDIRGVTYLDESARHSLARIFAKTRAEFIAGTPLTKYFAEQAQRKFHAESGNNLEIHSQPKVRKQS